MLCAHCQAAQATHECGHCHVTRYCSRDCQRAHWPQHRDRCPLLTSVQRAPSGSESSHTFLRPHMAPSYYSGASDAYRRARTLRFTAAHAALVQEFIEELVASRLQLAAQLSEASNTRMTVADEQARTAVWRDMCEAAYTASDHLHDAIPSAFRAEEMSIDPSVLAQLRQAIPEDVPLAWTVGYAEASAEVMMALVTHLQACTDTTLRSELIGAVSTCATAFMIARERALAKTRERRAQNAQGPPRSGIEAAAPVA